jgi:NAD(P)-dependent dehydrogenase (short-subunit alcohol dehydrogenase family)
MTTSVSSFRFLFELGGQTALVTGACGILGRRFCAGLAEFGANLAVVDLDAAACVALAQEIEGLYGTRCRGFACDVSDWAQVSALVPAVEKELGPISILINNAASKSGNLEDFFAPAETFKPETWRQVMGVNLEGMFNMARGFGPRMAQRGAGSIIQTASIYGIMAPDQRIYEGSNYLGRAINTPAVYTASKAGVIGLTAYLATLWGDRGVRVNSLSPGGVESGQNETFVRRYSARVPMGRMARADEMVGAVIYLASSASSYFTGQNLVVDGGLSAW